MTNSLRIAYYCTSHGLGHATRVIEVCKALCAIEGHVTVVTCISAQVFRDDAKLEEFYQKQLFEVRNLEKPLDCGAIQSDALTVEPLETLDRYYNIAVTNRKQLLDTEVAWMKEARIQVVVSDVVPLACAAAAVLSIPSACLTNFSWDYVYADYLKRENPSKAHIDMVNTIKEDYSHAKVLIRLPGYSAMPAFRSIVDIPFVVRHAQNTREAVRRQYGIKKDTKLLLLMFGGQPGGHEWPFPIDAIPPGWTCAACHAAWPQSPRKGASVSKDFVHLPSNTYLPDIIAASDCILGKIGYGCVSEVSTVHTSK